MDIISTVAGYGAAGLAGDGSAATSAQLDSPVAVSAVAGGGFLIADTGNNRVRRVSDTGIIATVAGSSQGFSGDGGRATDGQLDYPNGVAAMADGSFLIADTNNHRIRHVAPSTVITTVAGTGTPGFSGDDGPASAAEIGPSYAVAASPDGGFLIADTLNQRVRRVSPAGIISTVAGTGAQGFSGDGTLAISAELDTPLAVAATADGGFLIADMQNDRVRKVTAAGMISTVAGSTPGFLGDGTAATSAQLASPRGVAAAADGSFVVADMANQRIRRVSAAGIISTLAGTTRGFSGDGTAAASAQLSAPAGIALAEAGTALIADRGNERVRRVGAA